MPGRASQGDQGRWAIWIDRGGTFTDCVMRHSGTGQVLVSKVLSGPRSALEAVRCALGRSASEALPQADWRLGTTVATNALLERQGARTVLISNTGLGDLLRLDDQTRPSLFALGVARPVPLAIAREVSGRLDAGGHELEPLDEGAAEALFRGLAAEGVEALAIALLHSTKNPDHERALAEVAAPFFDTVVCSHEVSGARGLLARAQTAALDAYLTPVLQRSLHTLRREIPDSELLLMQSSGDLLESAQLRGRNAVGSGPAAGVIACAAWHARVGQPILGFDMGGTSTDVCRVDGTLERTDEMFVDGVRVRAPALQLHTIAAGGGSICEIAAGRYLVGPRSAGADPGPLCYGRAGAGHPTLTDAAVTLGLIPEGALPIPIDRARARAGFESLDPNRTPEACAAGFVRVAVETMATAIEVVSTARGHDPRDHALLSFGGAGGQYACAIAERLGIRRVVLPPFAGVFSAWGMGVASVGRHAELGCEGVLDAPHLQRVRDAVATLERTLDSDAETAPADTTTYLALRLAGMEQALEVPFSREDSLAEVLGKFGAVHRAHFGYENEGTVHASHVRAHRLERQGGTAFDAAVGLGEARSGDAPTPRRVRRFMGGAWREIDCVARQDVRGGENGPLVVLDATSTCVVDEGWRTRREGGLLVLERVSAGESPTVSPTVPRDASIVDPVSLAVMTEQFKSIADRMGVRLQRTASSANMRDRLDFSCAIFDRAGQLIANAPHIPVHLGAMGESVRAVLRRHPTMRPGDAFATNDPREGGSHLPDITVVMPVFGAGDDHPRFFVGCRGHHADIGGVEPGSMPASSGRLSEEGVLIDCVPLVREGAFQTAQILRALSEGPYPARQPNENLADLRAQVAACHLGVELLLATCDRHSAAFVERYMGFACDEAERAVRRKVGAMPDGTHTFSDRLDDGTVLQVRVDIEGEQLRIDFAGTSARHAGNLNAPRAVTRACVLFVLRALLGESHAPLNDGFLRSVELHVPPGSVLDPFVAAGAAPPRSEEAAAVAAGNVETSQRVVDVLFGALGLAAAGQGTMNNLTLGNEGFGYYETIAGGAGAGDGFEGPSGVQVHMTNSRITDPEVVESRFPLRVRVFRLRTGSGGEGRHHGGDGVVRELEALVPLRGSVLTERRRVGPFGLAGGAAGLAGINTVVHADGSETRLAGHARFLLEPGERIRIETPGGGGFGPCE